MKYVYSTENPKRYRFPTHINDLVMDRSEAATSEVFLVIVEPSKATPMHTHGDTEQVYYVLSGAGSLAIGNEEEAFPMKPGDIVRIPARTPHQVSCAGEEDLRYITVDCFLGGRPEVEPTWESHVRVVCNEQGWNFDDVSEA
jgi:mannose-6-phosphate isomerase-like protein (cupin superfamily)